MLKKNSYDISVAWQDHNIIGESPLWDSLQRALYWVDVYRPSIQRFSHAGGYKAWPMPNKLGSLALREGGGLIAATQRGFCEFDPATGELAAIVDPEADRPGNRLNDGKVDRAGRYWCVSRDATDDHAGGALFRLEPDHSCRKMAEGFIVGNGVAFSPDDKTMIIADTYSQIVYAYDFDLQNGEISNRREFFNTRGVPWFTDGGTFDAEGFYWCALVFDWSIGRFDPTGRLDRLIRLPVNAPTMCCFGGDGLETLYVTTATRYMSEEDKRAQPLAGAVLAINGLGVRGVPEPRFAG